MKAVIMAGGEGSRLRPLTCDRPKPLVPVCNRPVMAYTLDLLAEHGCQEVFVTLGYRPEAISGCFGDVYRGMPLHYTVEKKPLGTAGGVAALAQRLDAPFLVISGDALTDVNLSDLVAYHRRMGAAATLAMTRVESPLEYGVVMTDRNGRIRRFMEKPSWGEVFSDTVNTGIYVLEPSVLTGVPRDRPYDFSQHLFPALLRLGAPLFGRVADGYWCDIGDLDAYLQANLDLLGGRLRFQPPGQQVAPGIWTACDVPQGLLVDGPALIGEGCHLQPGTRLEAGAVLGPGTITGTGAVLRRSVTWSGVRVGADAAIVGAVVCEGAVLDEGAGVFDGAVVGANCSIGARATVAPGVRIWPRVEVESGARVDCTLVQSTVWTGRLLRQGSLVGKLGAELFPENILRVGTAFAAVLPSPGKLVVGSDPGAAATLLKQSLLCGAMAAGRGVVDIGTTASPVTEHVIARQNAAGGFHVRASGEQARVVFYDSDGHPARRDLQRKLEQACLRQDFPRATAFVAGTAERFVQAEWLYLEYLSEQIDCDLIRSAGFSVQVEGEFWPVLRRWLQRLHCTPGRRGRLLRLQVCPLEAAWQLVGFAPAEMLALEIWLHTGDPARNGEPVPIPVTAPVAVETLLQQCGRQPVRVRQADWRAADPLLAIGRLLERMARENLTQRKVKKLLPAAALTQRAVACPWAAKGRVMRILLEEHSDSAVDLVDGLRVRHPSGWALLLPDPDEPICHVYTEAATQQDAEALADHYVQRVLRSQAQ